MRVKYVTEKLANRGADGLPILPEVFLDESYCNKNHTRGSTWIDNTTGIQYKPSGKGLRVVMVGAGVLRGRYGKLLGEFVPNSLQIWEAKAAAVVGDDYHGNFDSDIFETWFEDLCYNAMISYGPVTIHMDGASYHLRNLSPSPTTAWRKDEIQDWLTARDIWWDAKYLKPDVLALSKMVAETKEFACVKIAANYGHRVLITPPYHPELQPIEIVWARVKNAVAASPQRSMSELKTQLRVFFEELVTTETWCGAYRKAQGFEDKYWSDHQASLALEVVHYSF
ncbi:hypothetical protein P43SY_009406 [Pythium insidiosum]|uniref:Tc1-like transposase DDE domain-containing protein n=1 Tax=Pythium insidiosum TaxID=114742 RepID=A0AAD5LJW5_PYTIN|nr:hypothetical protein P43SY_009406 [Pythium insidiosum]